MPHCPKCAGAMKKEELSMTSKHGAVLGNRYLFNTYICKRCGFTELYFKNKPLL